MDFTEVDKNELWNLQSVQSQP